MSSSSPSVGPTPPLLIGLPIGLRFGGRRQKNASPCFGRLPRGQTPFIAASFSTSPRFGRLPRGANTLHRRLVLHFFPLRPFATGANTFHRRLVLHFSPLRLLAKGESTCIASILSISSPASAACQGGATRHCPSAHSTSAHNLQHHAKTHLPLRQLLFQRDGLLAALARCQRLPVGASPHPGVAHPLVRPRHRHQRAPARAVAAPPTDEVRNPALTAARRIRPRSTRRPLPSVPPHRSVRCRATPARRCKNARGTLIRRVPLALRCGVTTRPRAQKSERLADCGGPLAGERRMEGGWRTRRGAGVQSSMRVARRAR